MSNYTIEMTEEMVKTYTNNPTRATVEALANKFNRPLKSIIGKLAKEGVYQREAYKTKTGLPVETKVEIVTDICDLLELEVENMVGLEKTPKGTLQKLRVAIQQLS